MLLKPGAMQLHVAMTLRHHHLMIFFLFPRVTYGVGEVLKEVEAAWITSFPPNTHLKHSVGEIKVGVTTSWEIDPQAVGTGSGAGEEADGQDKRVNLGQK